MTILESRTDHWTDEAGCAAAAGSLALRPGLDDAFVELIGPLGAGKTTFARHLLHALGVRGSVKSPTYALMEPYEVPRRGADAADAALQIWHFDFYRFDDPAEWEDAGFRELFASTGLKLVEWPDKAAGLLPRSDLRLLIEPLADEQRRVLFVAHTARGVELLA